MFKYVLNREELKEVLNEALNTEGEGNEDGLLAGIKKAEEILERNTED